jgi:hypothetical protein
MVSKESFRNKNTEKKYIKADLGESAFNFVNWTEIKDNDLWFFHCTHPCQCNTMFLWSTDPVMAYMWNVSALEVRRAGSNYRCYSEP